MDIIPLPIASGQVRKNGFVCANMEDGVVIADADLRAAWAANYPESWQRIVARRAFMIDVLGIKIKQDVLPMSNILAYYAPYFLNFIGLLLERYWIFEANIAFNLRNYRIYGTAHIL